LGEWTVFRAGSDAAHDTTADLTIDRAFALMLNMAGFNWSIVSDASGGYRLALLLKGRRLKPPVGTPLTLSEFSAPICSHSDDRRMAEREIKLEVLMRGCDGVEARHERSMAEAGFTNDAASSVAEAVA
jgi:hypothetical protein